LLLTTWLKAYSTSFYRRLHTLSILNEAEQEERETKQERGVVQHLLPGGKQRCREETLPEEVISDDDHKVRDSGRRVRTQESEDDSSYKSSQGELGTAQDGDIQLTSGIRTNPIFAVFSLPDHQLDLPSLPTRLMILNQ
jgi:hypothetical protein